MDNLLSYCGLVDAKIRASDKDLPVWHINFFWLIKPSMGILFRNVFERIVTLDVHNSKLLCIAILFVTLL